MGKLPRGEESSARPLWDLHARRLWAGLPAAVNRTIQTGHLLLKKEPPCPWRASFHPGCPLVGRCWLREADVHQANIISLATSCTGEQTLKIHTELICPMLHLFSDLYSSSWAPIKVLSSKRLYLTREDNVLTWEIWTTAWTANWGRQKKQQASVILPNTGPLKSI